MHVIFCRYRLDGSVISTITGEAHEKPLVGKRFSIFADSSDGSHSYRMISTGPVTAIIQMTETYVKFTSSDSHYSLEILDDEGR